MGSERREFVRPALTASYVTHNKGLKLPESIWKGTDLTPGKCMLVNAAGQEFPGNVTRASSQDKDISQYLTGLKGFAEGSNIRRRSMSSTFHLPGQ